MKNRKKFLSVFILIVCIVLALCMVACSERVAENEENNQGSGSGSGSGQVVDIKTEPLKSFNDFTKAVKDSFADDLVDKGNYVEEDQNWLDINLVLEYKRHAYEKENGVYTSTAKKTVHFRIIIQMKISLRFFRVSI